MVRLPVCPEGFLNETQRLRSTLEGKPLKKRGHHVRA